MTHPRGDEIRSTIDGIWDAVGADDDAVAIHAYSKQSPRSYTGCQHLDEDDRWYGERGSALAPGHMEPAVVEEALVGHLVAEGFRVDLYNRTSRTESDLPRLYWATKGEMVVDGIFSADGATTVHVRSGPCAPFVGSVDPDLFDFDRTVGGPSGEPFE